MATHHVPPMEILNQGVQNPQPSFSINPYELEFGKKFAANMFVAKFQEDRWGKGEIVPLADFSLHPGALVFHYAQGVFEGLKAYKREGGAALFRPGLNAERMVRSAERMSLPPFPAEWFLQASREIVKANLNFIPDAPGTLYLRPTLIGTEAVLGVRASQEAMFYIICLPTGSYFKGNVAGPGAVDVLVAEDTARAFAGGTGSAKAAANYALSLRAIEDGKKAGCAQVLFLDAATKSFVEEMGGMNVFFSDGKKLVTPELGDTILPGVTRQSVIDFARAEGIPVEERKVPIREILDGIANGSYREGFACGTAAVVTGIRSFKSSSNGKVFEFSAAPGEMTKRVYEVLTGIQFGTRADAYGWMEPL